MRIIYFTLMVFILTTGCTPKSDEKIIQEMQRAAEVLSKQNLAQFHRIEKLYKSDSSNAVIKGLYIQLSNIRDFKEAYKKSISTQEHDTYLNENEKFINNLLSQLDDDEKKLILQKFKDSPIFNKNELESLGNNETLLSLLLLESELITQESFLIVMKDFKKKKQDFDWEIYW